MVRMDDREEIHLDLAELKRIRHTLHRMPELGFEEVRTAAYIADRLTSLGYRVHRGLAKTGVVGTIRKGVSKRAIGLRADMDGLPIAEQGAVSYASENPGKMHACGHDGHMAMLLGAAAAIAQRGRFDGTVHLIFQPGEENFGGAKAMVAQGLFERFPCDAVFSLHNAPNLPLGHFALREGPIMAAVDEAKIMVQGRGGHGAAPEDAADPIVAGASIVMALQTIVSRNIKPFIPAVVTVGAFHAGSASNIIPDTAELVLTIRSFDADIRDYLEKRITEISRLQAESYGMQAIVNYRRSYDATVNHPAETAFVRAQAQVFAGAEMVIDLAQPFMGSEDFSYMLQACPGCYFFIGTQSSPEEKPLHHPAFDFSDAILPVGAKFWTHLTEAFLAPAV
jgi:hippurate hydrolase